MTNPTPIKQAPIPIEVPDIADLDDPSFGPCCACGEEGRAVRNLVLLPLKALQPANGGAGGWGCEVCHLPTDGAVAVVCDRCAKEDRPVREACVGYPALKVRVPMVQLTEPFGHDLTFHPELRIHPDLRNRDVPNTLFEFGSSAGPGHGGS